MFNRRNDDELISAYIDGQLDERSRLAFEARINRDAALRRRVDATRTLVMAARTLPAVGVPRNFILPSNAAVARQPARAPAGARLWWRFGSALAAAVFVVAIGLDTLGSAMISQPMMSAAPQPAPTMAAQVASSNIQEATAAPPSADRAGGQSPAATAAPASTAEETPQAMAQSAMAATPTEATTAAAASLAPKAAETTATAGAESLSAVNPTSVEQTPAPKAFSLRAAPEPTETPTVEPAPVTAERPVEKPAQAPWWRIVAGLAFLAAIGAGIMGWLHR